MSQTQRSQSGIEKLISSIEKALRGPTEKLTPGEVHGIADGRTGLLNAEKRTVIEVVDGGEDESVISLAEKRQKNANAARKLEDEAVAAVEGARVVKFDAMARIRADIDGVAKTTEQTMRDTGLNEVVASAENSNVTLADPLDDGLPNVNELLAA